MPRKSTKENKNIYQICRENKGLTREAAAELLETMDENRIKRIEGGAAPRPDEILRMADKYCAPLLCNHYCVNNCELGESQVHEITQKNLQQITLEMIHAINELSAEKDRLIAIAVDGKVTEDELPDFKRLRKQLDAMASIIGSLQLWVDENMQST